MPSLSAKRNFAAYLACPIERYPIDRIPLSLSPERDTRKELIFQQSLHLEVAKEYLPTKPWVTYFATIKHFRLMSAKDVNTAAFNELGDKQFASEIAATAEELRDAAAHALDDETRANLNYLCGLQEATPLIAAARNALDTIASSKHYKAVALAVSSNTPVIAQTSGCLLVAMLLGFIFIAVAIGGLLDDAHWKRVIRFIILFPAAFLFLVVYGRRFLKDIAAKTVASEVNALWSSFQTDVVPAAQLLGGEASGFALARQWLENSPQGREYLDSAMAKKRQFEETYLNLDDGPP
jgi:hypothetical protein